MAGIEESISDETMAGLTSQILTGRTTEMTDSILAEDSHDLFDTTMTGLVTSTQVKTIMESNSTQTEDDLDSEQKKSTLCMEDCKFKDTKPKKTDKAGPVQCYMCQHWIHPPCVNEQDVNIVNIWACPKCRTVSDTLQNVLTLMKNIQEDNKHQRTFFTDKLNNLQDKMDNYTKKCEQKDNLNVNLNEALKLKSSQHQDAINEVSKLKHKINDLTTKLENVTWRNFRTKTPTKTVVFGSSLVRDISESHLEDTQVVCIPGGKIKEISKAIVDRQDDFHQAVVVVGGNDCDPREPARSSSPSDIVEEYRSLVKRVKAKARVVNISSVCPRIKSDAVKSRIDAVNAGLQVMCDEEDVKFTDNTPSFYLQDGTINDGYLLRDGVHLTNKATDRLAKNLQLKLKDGFSTVCTKYTPAQKNNERQKRPKEPQVNQDNTDIDTSHAFWSHAAAKVKVTPRQHRQDPKMTNSATTRTTNNEKPRCYNCYETNHTVKTCRHEHPIVCRECGTEGHKAKHHTHGSHDY